MKLMVYQCSIAVCFVLPRIIQYLGYFPFSLKLTQVLANKSRNDHHFIVVFFFLLTVVIIFVVFACGKEANTPIVPTRLHQTVERRLFKTCIPIEQERRKPVDSDGAVPCQKFPHSPNANPGKRIFVRWQYRLIHRTRCQHLDLVREGGRTEGAFEVANSLCGVGTIQKDKRVDSAEFKSFLKQSPVEARTTGFVPRDSRIENLRSILSVQTTPLK